MSQRGLGVTTRFWDLGCSPWASRAIGASRVPQPRGDGPRGEVFGDFEVTAVTARSVTATPSVITKVLQAVLEMVSRYATH